MTDGMNFCVALDEYYTLLVMNEIGFLMVIFA